MSDYRPGQLYSGREGDLLFTVLAESGIEFVTNRGTRVPLEQAERVYAPLTLVRDVGTGAESRVLTALTEVDERGQLHALTAVELTGLVMAAIAGETGAEAEVVRTEPCDECESKGRNCTAHGGRTGISPVYPAPGSAIPGMPGYVVATCDHRIAAMEWRSGFRVCERCPDKQAEGGR